MPNLIPQMITREIHNVIAKYCITVYFCAFLYAWAVIKRVLQTFNNSISSIKKLYGLQMSELMICISAVIHSCSPCNFKIR